MTINTWFAQKIISTELALAATALLIGGSMLYSMYKTASAADSEKPKTLRWWIPGTPARKADPDTRAE
jgi:tellurite resistance protein TerC